MIDRTTTREADRDHTHLTSQQPPVATLNDRVGSTGLSWPWSDRSRLRLEKLAEKLAERPATTAAVCVLLGAFASEGVAILAARAKSRSRSDAG